MLEIRLADGASTKGYKRLAIAPNCHRLCSTPSDIGNTVQAHRVVLGPHPASISDRAWCKMIINDGVFSSIHSCHTVNVTASQTQYACSSLVLHAGKVCDLHI